MAKTPFSAGIGGILVLLALAACVTSCTQADSTPPEDNTNPEGAGGAREETGGRNVTKGGGGSKTEGGSKAPGGTVDGPEQGGDDDGVGGTVKRGSGGTKSGGDGTGKGGNKAAGSGGAKSTAGTSNPGATGGTADTGTPPPAGSGLIGDVQFSEPSQTFKGQIEVGLTTTAGGGEIRYTTDGTVPTASSTLYDGKPLTIKATTQLRAQTFVDGQASGAMSTAIYVPRTVDPTSDIPIILVEGYGKGKPCDKNIDFDAAVMIWEPVDGVASMASLPTLVARAGYHARGQSSLTFAQTSYKIEFWDNANNDLDYPVLGMPADSDWALVAPYYDRTLIRNPFTYELGKEMGMEAPRVKWAEVYVNQASDGIGDNDFEGIYWVSETIKNNSVRTNLKQLKEKDTDEKKLSGGYIFKFDQMAAEEPKLTCTGSNPLPGMTGALGGGARGGGAVGGGAWGGGAMGGGTTSSVGCPMQMSTTGFGTSTGAAGTCWIDLEVVDPNPLNDQQKTWLTTYIQQFHDSLHASPMGDYTTYIDIPTFVDYFIISELSLNVDAYTKSAYYFKDRDQKIKAGPLWDYNFALGGVGAMNATPQSTSETGWRYNGNRDVNNWYPQLMTDANFKAEVKARYTELRKTILSQASIEERMNKLSAPLKKAVDHDFTKWPVSKVISGSGFFAGPTGATWDEQIKAMHDFLVARLTWMDANLP